MAAGLPRPLERLGRAALLPPRGAAGRPRARRPGGGRSVRRHDRPATRAAGAGRWVWQPDDYEPPGSSMMPAGTVSPITLELVQGALESAVREMELLMERTAMSPFIKEKKDYFVGIFDRDGRMVCAHVGNSGPGMIEPVLKVYPREDMRPGDIYWYNDPYATAGAVEHSPDMVFVMPVFFGEELVAFALTFGHFWDIGGTMAGSISPRATEIYHEGVLVPPIRIYRAGQLNEEVYRVFLRNSRFPDMLEGDTRAMHASCRLGERRVIELFERFGHGVVLTAFDELIANARRTARRLVGALIKEGTYESSAYVDGDGLSNRSFKIQLR